jgi:outer membrane lipoprotein SlyB
MHNISVSFLLSGAILLMTGCVTDSDYPGNQTYSQPTYGSSSYSGSGSQVVCRDVVVTHNRSADSNRLIGTATGAALGGLVGNQFGGGAVNTGATAAGVIAGGYAGNQVQKKMQQGDTYTTTERVCEPVQ